MKWGEEKEKRGDVAFMQLRGGRPELAATAKRR